ncbi:MAG: PilN domain-containing protein [Gemmatimonas sp.]|jgi:hypothetical protein|uniref:PilN domain-containing protein n=1 Tax=Gemmatimonas sp. TaxID=1962908 RepID=UPI00391FB39F|nr:PilN domain-containing protein [Gemmatimonadota bacterium]
MSEPLAIVLEHETLRVFGRGVARPLLELPWDAEAPDAALPALVSLVAAPSAAVLIVGLAWLEIAQPALPPVAPAVRRRMLHLGADRWFALTGTGAFAVHDELAFAVPAEHVRRWRDAFGRWAPIAAVVALPHAVWLLDRDGTWSAEAGPGERGLIEVGTGHLTAVRRTRRDLAVAPPLELAACADAVLASLPVPGDLQLLEVASDAAQIATQRRRWWRAGAVLAAAVAACAWALGTAQERRLLATRALVARLEVESAPARAANARLQRALAETDGLRADATRSRQAGAPARVLARLGALLPADAFVQRLEWDGTAWRIDGSAVDAAALVPRLDADPAFEEVRTLAPSTRFIDAGRPRSSFSIGFRVREGA